MNKTILLALWIILLVVGITAFYFIRVENERLTAQTELAVTKEREATATLSRLEHEIAAWRKAGAKLPPAPVSINWRKGATGDKYVMILHNNSAEPIDFRISVSNAVATAKTAYLTISGQASQEIGVIHGHQFASPDQISLEAVGFAPEQTKVP